MEYLGATMVVVLVVLSLLMVATPIGNQIAAKLCAAVGTTCGGGAVTGGSDPKAPPTDPCTVQTDDTHLEAGISVSFISLGESGDMSVEQLSDETYKVTVNGELGVEASLSAGEATGKLYIGEYGAGLEVEASVAAGVFAGAGVEYEFADKKSADEFTDYVERTVAKEGAKAILPGPGIAVEAGSWLLDKITGYSYTPPAPSASFYEGGVSVGGSASGDLLTAGASASADAKSALGAKVDHATGDITVYTKVTLDAEASAKLGFSATDGNWGAGGEGSAGVEMVVATTFDEDMTITGVSLDGAATAEGAGSLTALTGIPMQGGGGKGVQMSAKFPVTNANRTQVVAALTGLGALAVQPGGTGLSTALAIPAIINEARGSGDITAQTLDVNSSNLVDAALALEAPAIGGLGFSLGANTASSTSTGAYYLDNNGWQVWAACAA
ncbi:MAG: hypothetical protein HGA44_14635 [Cellulomonadaceae bacterium]|nr:hypothetical protein [Cellulomonadaceae bacterium]